MRPLWKRTEDDTGPMERYGREATELTIDGLLALPPTDQLDDLAAALDALHLATALIWRDRNSLSVVDPLHFKASEGKMRRP